MFEIGDRVRVLDIEGASCSEIGIRNLVLSDIGKIGVVLSGNQVLYVDIGNGVTGYFYKKQLALVHDKEYLITFSFTDIDGNYCTSYSWLEDEEEMLEEIQFNKRAIMNFKIIDKLRISNYTDLE